MNIPHSNRRQFVIKAATVTFGASFLPWQQLLAAPLLTGKNIRELRGGVYSAQGGGGTMGLFMDKDAVVVVDTQNHKSAAAIAAQIKQLTERKIEYVINTHHHADHIGGNNALSGIANELVAHEYCAKIQKNRKNHWQPTVQFADVWSQRAGAEVVTLHHFGQAHTGGDAIVHFENANVVHAGDVIWHRRGPRVDHAGGCNMMRWIEVLDEMDRKFDAETIYIFGHGNQAKNTAGDRKFLREFRDYLSNTMELVDKRHQVGDSLEEILKIKQVPGSEPWPYSARTLKGAYAEVTGKVEPVAYTPLEEACCGLESHQRG